MSILNVEVGIISNHISIQSREKVENEKLFGDSAFLYVTDFFSLFRLFFI